MPAKRMPIERRIRPDVSVVLDVEGVKRTFRLCFDFNALARFEEKTGVDCLEINAPWQKMGAGKLGALFWSGALFYHPEYDSDEGLAILRSLLDQENAVAAFEGCWEAYLLYLPKAQAQSLRDARKKWEAEQANPPKPATSENQADPPANQPNGESSGPSPDTTLTSVASANSGS